MALLNLWSIITFVTSIDLDFPSFGKSGRVRLLQLFAESEVNIVEKSPRQSRGDYSAIFTEPEVNNCFSIIAQVIIRATAFLLFYLFLL